MIPKKLYFTYLSEDLPTKYQNNLKKWKTMYPDWEFCFYSDKAVYQLFEKHFPQYYEELSKIPYGAMLADFFRYAVLSVHGGLYSDIDTCPLKKIPKKWLEYDCILGYEYQPSKFPKSFRIPWRDQEFMCQWTLLSAPNYPLFKDALKLSFERLRKINYAPNNIFDVLHTSGPLLITDIVKNYSNKTNVLILDADYFGCGEGEHFPFTDRSLIKHQGDEKNIWKIQVQLPHLKHRDI